MLRVVQQCLPFLGIDAARKKIRIVAGEAAQGKDFTRLGVHGNDCARLLTHGLKGDFLQPCINGEVQILAGNGGHQLAQGLQFPTKMIHLHLASTIGPDQHFVADQFHSGFAFDFTGEASFGGKVRQFFAGDAHIAKCV